MIADLEEIVGYVLFGIPDKVIQLGYGSHLAIVHLTVEVLCTGRVKWESFCSLYWEKLENASKEELDSLGLFIDSQGVIRNIINQRQHTCTDIEHAACKFGMGISCVHRSRSRSTVPKCASGYCWPLPSTAGEWVKKRDIVEVLERIVAATKNMLERNAIKVAAQFMLLSEEEYYEKNGVVLSKQ